MNQHIYVIDDEASITEALQFALEREGFSVTVFHTGQDVIPALQQEDPALLILDVGLTDGSGFDFFRQYRDISNAPLIFLTARSDEIDRVVGLEMGADDYISKPFSVRELIARVRVVLRREENHRQSTDGSTLSKQGAFIINSLEKSIQFHETALTLTAHEYRLLELLISQPGRVFSRVQLLESISESPEHRLERTIDTHIKGIRLKLREINDIEDPIVTHRGMGYSLKASS